MYSFKLFHKLKDIELYWSQIPKKGLIYDDWEYNLHIGEATEKEAYCYIIFRGSEVVGILPMLLEKDGQYLFLSYPSGYIFESLFKEAEAFFYILEKLPFPYKIKSFIFSNEQHIPEGFIDAGTDAYYYMELEKDLSLEKFLQQRFSSKNRCSLRNQFKKIEEQKIQIVESRRDDFKIAIQYNIERFGEKSVFYNDSYFIGAQNELSKKENFWILTFLLGESIKVVTYGFFIGDVCYFLFSGTKNEDIPNIGKYAYMKTIEYAAKRGSKIFDAGFGDYNWKESWKFKKRLTYNFEGDIGKNLLTLR